VDAYLQRIGVSRPAHADLDALRVLQRAHLGTVPFENLSIHLGERIRLDEPALLNKIVQRRRGGFCYELNGAFALLLTDLGYRVTLHSARTWGGTRYGFPFDHLALVVDLGAPWLVDVGFGTFGHHPVRLDVAGPQPDPGGSFAVVPHGGEDWDVSLDGSPQYRLDRRPYEIGDFGPACWFHQTSPDSHFTTSLTCSRLTGDGRITLSGHTLITTTGADRHERILDEAETLQVYREQFGIALDRLPAQP